MGIMRSYLTGAFVVCLLCVAGAAVAGSQTVRKVTPTEKESETQLEAERAAIRNPQPAATPSNEIRCRGGQNKLIFTAENSKVGPTGEAIIITLLTFEPASSAAGPRGEGLRPGECAWADRPINGRFLIRFETPANAQLKQSLHGSEVDRSPTAAESYPDSRTIPIYMQDPNHYWSFFGPKPVNNFFTATGNGSFKPGTSIKDIHKDPDAFKQRKRPMTPKP
ncbi:MAG: hypothetical protein ACJ741_10135 [Pyrinomonadaceae bacterium]